MNAARGAIHSAWREEFAYEDVPLPIGEGQTISQPYVVAQMVDVPGVPETYPFGV